MNGAGHGDEGRLVAGRYRLLERIGRGGMGTVWLAEDELLGRQVAVKKLHPPQPHMDDEELATLFERTRREARAAARISHPNVVVVHDVVDDAGLPSIVMEYVPSVTLGERLKEQGPLEPAEAARIGRGMVAALRAAHRAGVLHRDVKPGNVLLGVGGPSHAEGDGGDRIVLTDFGIAQASGTSTLTRTGELIGSIDFLSPERIRGALPGPESDLWALGATLYQAVEGISPFRRPTAIETAYAIAEEPLEPPGKAGGLADLIAGLLVRDPQQRLSAEEAERMLRLPAAEADTAEVERDRFGAAQPPRTGTTVVTPMGVAAAPQGGEPAQEHPDSAREASAGPAEPQPAAQGRDGDVPRGAQHGGPPASHRSGAAPRRRRRALPWIAAVVVVALAAGGALYAVHRLHSGGADASAGGSPTPTVPTTSPAPTTTAPSPAPTTPPPPKLPAGYRLAKEHHDGYDYSVPVPDGWTRSTPNGTDEVDWLTADGLVGLKVNALPFGSTDPLEHFEEVESQTEKQVDDYDRKRMDRTLQLGEQAALWEFTFKGKVRDWHAIDLGFGKPGGTEYAIYLSAPEAQWQQWLPVFNNAVAGFRAGD